MRNQFRQVTIILGGAAGISAGVGLAVIGRSPWFGIYVAVIEALLAGWYVRITKREPRPTASETTVVAAGLTFTLYLAVLGIASFGIGVLPAALLWLLANATIIPIRGASVRAWFVGAAYGVTASGTLVLMLLIPR